MRYLRTAVFFGLALAAAGTLRAQTAMVTNPTAAVFTASLDHAVTIDGVALVDGYTLEIHTYPDGALAATVNVGKPALDANGAITVVIPALPSGTFFGRAIATGPGGSAFVDSEPFRRVSAPRPPTNVRIIR